MYNNNKDLKIDIYSWIELFQQLHLLRGRTVFAALEKTAKGIIERANNPFYICLYNPYHFICTF